MGMIGGAARLAELRRAARVLPSLLSADFAALAASIEPLEAAGARALHLDVMDGHFVPNITFGPPLVRTIRAHARGFLDTHLMITDPLRYLEPFARAGSDLCTVHVETGADPAETAREARRLGIALGAAIRPSTDLDPAVERWAPHVDLILVMSVEPGFGGQAFRPEAVGRIERAREICARLGLEPILEVDGGVDPTTAPAVLGAGARWLVAGSAVFGQPDPVAAWREMERMALGISR
jgi:ribulose-phosphate 3-epimerase